MSGNQENEQDKDFTISPDMDISAYPPVFLSIARKRHEDILTQLENLRECVNTKDSFSAGFQSIESSLKIISLFYELTMEQLVTSYEGRINELEGLVSKILEPAENKENRSSSGCCFGNLNSSIIDTTPN